MKNIAIVSAFTADFRELADLTLPRLQLYAADHGYHLFSGEVPKPQDHHFDWDRMKTVARYLEDFETVMWIDCDALIANREIRIEEVFGQARLMVTADLHGLNSGVFIARNSPIVKQFFYALGGAGYDCFKNHHWQAQAAMIAMLSAPPYDQLATWVPQHVMNSYINDLHGWPAYFQGGYRKTDWIIHLAGVPMPTRLAWLKNFLEKNPNG